jgi:hypothetical protein
MMSPAFVDEHSENYAHFIESTYSNSGVLKSYIRGLQEFAKRDRALKEFEVAFRRKGLHWLVVGTDSVSLKVNPGLNYAYQPLVVEEEKFTAGLLFKDSVSTIGYFNSITPSRKPDISVTFPIDKSNYKHSTLPKSHAFIIADPGAQIFFVILHSDVKVQVNQDGQMVEKHPVSIAKIYRSDGLAWSNNFMMESIPSSATFTNGELLLKSNEGTWVIDKNGKMK